MLITTVGMGKQVYKLFIEINDKAFKPLIVKWRV